MTRRPRPGMLNTDSVTTTPLISSATPTPITVAMGTAALRRAWPSSTPVSPSPLARAVRMKSSPMTSMMLVRVMRAISATYTVDSASEGRTRRCR
ncbi:Uncharacterised protein [Bordetella pertussis]|nr:Uncharacterised protein [Bordetella pertussis]